MVIAKEEIDIGFLLAENALSENALSENAYTTLEVPVGAVGVYSQEATGVKQKQGLSQNCSCL